MSCNRCATASDALAPKAGAPAVEASWAGNRDHPQFCDKCHAFLRADGGCTRCEIQFEKSRGAIVDSLFGEEATIYPGNPEHRALLDKAAAMAAVKVVGPPQGELREMVDKALTALQEANSPGRRLHYARQIDALCQGQPVFRAGDYGDNTVRPPGTILRFEAEEMGNEQQLEDVAAHLQMPAERVCDHLDSQYQSAQWGATCEEVLTHYSEDGNGIEVMDIPADAQQIVDIPDGTLWGWNKNKSRDKSPATLAMTAPGDTPKMRLSCGHDSSTTVSPGGEEWCTECDDFATVDAPAPDPATARTSALSDPPSDWSSRRMKLWNLMEERAKRLGITSVSNDWTSFAPSDGTGDGKVYGGFYGQSGDGRWYSVVAYGPINRPAIQGVRDYPAETSARKHYSIKARSKLSGKYLTDWPCDGKGH